MTQFIMAGKVDAIFKQTEGTVTIGLISEGLIFQADASYSTGMVPFSVIVDDAELVRIAKDDIYEGDVIRVTGELAFLIVSPEPTPVIHASKIFLISKGLPEEAECPYCGTNHKLGPCQYVKPQNEGRK